MPNRIIKESICYSDDLDKLTPFEETVFYRLLVRVDDFGRIDARPGFLKSMLFVTKQGITEKNIKEAVARMASLGLVRLYEVDGKSFLMFPKWHLHQRVRNSKEKYPSPQDADMGNDVLPQVAASCGELPPISYPYPYPNPESEAESNKDIGARAKRTHTQPPSIDDVRAYCEERGNTIDAERFIDYYTAQGWVLANGRPVKDWRACVRTWEKNDKTDKTGNRSPSQPYRRETVGEHNDRVLNEFMRKVEQNDASGNGEMLGLGFDGI